MRCCWCKSETPRQRLAALRDPLQSSCASNCCAHHADPASTANCIPTTQRHQYPIPPHMAMHRRQSSLTVIHCHRWAFGSVLRASMPCICVAHAAYRAGMLATAAAPDCRCDRRSTNTAVEIPMMQIALSTHTQAARPPWLPADKAGRLAAGTAQHRPILMVPTKQ